MVDTRKNNKVEEEESSKFFINSETNVSQVSNRSNISIRRKITLETLDQELFIFEQMRLTETEQIIVLMENADDELAKLLYSEKVTKLEELQRVKNKNVVWTNEEIRNLIAIAFAQKSREQSCEAFGIYLYDKLNKLHLNSDLILEIIALRIYNLDYSKKESLKTCGNLILLTELLRSEDIRRRSIKCTKCNKIGHKADKCFVSTEKS